MKKLLLLLFCLYSLASVAQNPASKLSYELQRLVPGFIPIQTEGDEMVFDQIMYDTKGNIVVQLLAKTGSEVLVNELRAKNFEIIVTTKFTVTISVPVSRINELENVQEMRKARAEYKPGHGAVVSQGDTAMKSHLARVTYGVNGAGVKVGVLSDSYNRLGGAAAGVTNGELPGPGNPNGFTTPVELLQEGPSGSIDEGRAMIEIVHDVAPGATKAFATAFVGGQAGFANNIIALKDATCKVIVDDVFYFAEPFFQNGFIAQAVNTVKAAGVAYFSLAGNHARAAYANSFRAGSFTFPAGVTAGNVPAHNFAAPGDPDVYLLQLTGLAAARYTITLQWDEPFPSVSGGAGAQTNMDMYLYNSDGTSISGSATTNNLGGDPIEIIQLNLSGGTRNIAIRHTAGPAPQNLRIVIYTNGLPLTFGNTAVPGINASTLVGHPNTPGAISVGAVPWFRTPAYGVNPPVIESFSSLGGTPILFDDAGNRLPAPIVYSKPEITGPDGGNNSFFGGDSNQDTDTFRNFFGTSASAPHAAAVAALMIQSRNGQSPLTPDQIKTVMENSTIDMDDPDIAGFQTGFDFRTGHGLLQADLALAQVNCTTPITLTTGTIPNICQGTKSFTIPYTATTGSPISYSISGPGITSVNDVALAAAPSSITVNLIGGATLPSMAFNLQLKNANGCFSDTIKGTVTVDPASIVDAGPDQTVCDSDTIYLNATLSGVATNMVWQKNAAFGTFIGPDTQPQAKFVLNAAGKMLDSLSFGAMSNDPGGNVCQGGLDTVKIYIIHGPTVEAGPEQRVCASSPTVTLAGSKGGTATVATWSGGAGTFLPNNTTLNATYTPTPGEIAAGSVKLKLTTDDPAGICKAAVDSVVIKYDPAAIVDAGPDQTVCNSDTIYLSATLSGVATNMVWQKNAAFGTFIGPDTQPNAKFVLNAAGKMLDSLTFGAMTNDPGANVCQGGLDTVKIYIIHGPTVEAGPEQRVCSSSPTVTLAGSKGGTATVATWSGGAGTFTPNNTTLNATYTPTPGEITAGSVKLKLTTDDPAGICKAAVDSVIITYDPASIVNAGPDQAICNTDTIVLNATLSGVATNMVWQKNVAFGTFITPDTQPFAKFVLNATGKLLDSLSFGAMSNDPGANVCQGGLDTVKIYILHPAVPLVAEGDTINAGSSINLTATGCTGPSFTLRWYQVADDAPVSMPVSPLQTTAYYARCEQTRLSVTCQSGKSTEFIVTVLPSSTSIIYVNVANNAPAQDGSSWSKAFASLQQGLTAAAALHASASMVQVWVAQGTYKPGTLRKDVFSIPSGVKVFGGFVGTETLLEERNWKTNLTILSGEIGTSVPDDNTYHVVLFKSTNDTTQLDGFRVVRGFAEFFAGNQTNNLDDPSIQASGGGILAIEKSKGLIINCTITDNRATGGGGMHLRDSSHLHIIQSVIFGNEATFGGGVYVLGGSQPYFENVLFAINKGLGGGLYVNQSQPRLMNCTIASNKDGSNNVGGVYNSNATTTIQNSILWGNTPLQSTAGSNITNSIVEGGYTGTGNLSLNPLFVNPNPTGLAPMGVLGDYHLQVCSPAINSGSNAGAPNVDLDGNARPFPIGIGIADMGVYESQSAGSSGPNSLTVTEPITSGTVLKVAGKITATNQISGAKVVYQATNSVTLSPGFSATGNSFLAVIGDCSTPVPASAGSEESLNQK
ncbi:3-coathanger stack domain-containing protein [Runella salmonicolor]|uniref:S8 family serine peptidase n=1 Tax=Runella salmonicolor TaxID=2950278 RepID=A0ABT1FTU8_9BACT|nr:3-coathanger stack domain-containing protein [Runella salmonicolor]MCP1385200.1 S8 family serine peptidase [Runella salmonicolor]